MKRFKTELLDLVGFSNLELLGKLFEKREFIKSYCKVIETQLADEKKQNEYKPKITDVRAPGSQVTVERGGGGKKGKFKKRTEPIVPQDTKISNYDLLQKLGFNKSLIAENKRLGLKERTMQGMDSYVN